MLNKKKAKDAPPPVVSVKTDPPPQSLRDSSAAVPIIDNNTPFKWKKGMLLGRGAFGSVYMGLTSTGQMIAVKHIEISPDANPEMNLVSA